MVFMDLHCLAVMTTSEADSCSRVDSILAAKLL
jgi:hypothetical protein